MKTASPTRKLVLSALFLALGFVLPYLTGQIPQIGSMLLPMHIPVLLCGYAVGGPWALVVGAICPLLRSAVTSMPPFYPGAVSMAFELAAYGLVSGLVYRRLPRTMPMIYVSLVIAMAAGRIVWGAVRFIMLLGWDTAFSFSLFLSGAITTALPGIILQLVIIPPIVYALRRGKLID